jgi:glutamine---fructose-6-phosphate transaminase (isomerizing)
MCGIVAILRRPSSRSQPSPGELVDRLEAALAALDGPPGEPALAAAAEAVEEVDRLLRGVPGLLALAGNAALPASVDARAAAVEQRVSAIEAALDEGAADLSEAGQEAVNAAIVRLKDATWAVRRDRLRKARATSELAGRDAGPAGLAAFATIQTALSAIDRLEVRGRDSAGIHVLVTGHGLDVAGPAVRALLERRAADPLFLSTAVRAVAAGVDGQQALSFVYKAAAEIGELGDNTRALRAAITDDPLLHLALASDAADAAVLAHTRWASVGIISEANAHPLNSEELAGAAGPYVVAALNGDIDNYADLIAAHDLRVAAEITTDAKVIPVLTARRLATGEPAPQAFRRTVAAFEGSVAIAAHSAADPAGLLLAQRGSGQALYVGLAEDAYVVASEPYGLVEETARYVRLDGETPSNPDNPASTGQVVALDGRRAGEVGGILRMAYDGTVVPVDESEIVTATITTRDIDRGEFPHYLLKEIHEAPASFRKTLRGRIREREGRLTVTLGRDTLPDEAVARLADGRIRHVTVIGQGTAAVAGQSLAAALDEQLAGSGVAVTALPATELSGFHLREDMSDTLVVAISQSGTTTDTNRTVDLVKERGGLVVAIVNRRNSDLTDKAHGVLYTSDGRDVEMSVASTKAFYAQVAAGFLLAYAIADHLGAGDGDRRAEVLAALRSLPEAMDRTLELRPRIAEAAARHAPGRRYWAVVGNGANRITAAELRIKLSELCYKSIACDATEDKKHIDLSSEPLILVCAAGLGGSTADDVAKEVAIYRAHKAAPLVIATEGQGRYDAALEVFTVPATAPALAFVLAALAGHLFGYEAALAIDASARPLRETRASIDAAIASGRPGDLALEALRPAIEPPTKRFLDGLRTGGYDGHLEASTAVRLASMLRYATGVVPLEAYQVEHGKVGSPSVVVEDLNAALTRAIEELTRPVDAIKHQAKTVTVGISRSDETLLRVPLVGEVLAAGVARDGLSYRALRTLAALDGAVDKVTGYTHYRIDGDPAGVSAAIAVVDRGGVAAGIPSRTDRDPRLRGTKRRVANERDVLVERGAADGRTILLVPEVKGGVATGIGLLHVRFRDHLPVPAARTVLEGYRNRYAELSDAVTETEPSFRDDLLADVPVFALLTEPVQELAARWRR